MNPVRTARVGRGEKEWRMADVDTEVRRLQVANLPKQGFYGGLRLAPSTLSRKNKDDTLDAAVTERLVRQSELMVKAAEVFGDGAGTWMTKAHPLLEGRTPLDAASNEYGGVKVRQILNAIEHGGVV